MLKVGDYVRDNRKKFEGDIGILIQIRTHKSPTCYVVKWIKLCKNSSQELSSDKVGKHSEEVLEKIIVEEKDIPKLLLEVL